MVRAWEAGAEHAPRWGVPDHRAGIRVPGSVGF
jgi:hypothetical protein